MANDLNHFYLRFETHDFAAECFKELDSLSPTECVESRLRIDPQYVRCLFKHVSSKKPLGPDRISPFYFKTM